MTSPAPGDSHPKWQQLTNRVIADIDAGRTPPGTALPSIGALAEQGFGRGPALQAYRWLVAHGYVVTRHGKGTFVADRPPASGPAGGDAPSNAELAAEVAQLRERLDAHLRRHQGDSPAS